MGAIYKVKADGSDWRLVASFSTHGLNNGGAPRQGGLVDDGNGFFWGTAFAGGAANLGGVFKINSVTGEIRTVLEFIGAGGQNKGAQPIASLVADGSGFFWGSSTTGGQYGGGTVFKVNAVTEALTTLVEFVGAPPYGRSP